MGKGIRSHYVSRLLTKAWETSNRDLHFYDRATNTLGRKPSVRLFTVRGLHTPATEGKLNRLIEDVVGKYQEHCKATGNPVAEPDERTTRALIGLAAFQIARATEALSTERPKYTLDQMLSEEHAFDWMVDQFARDHYFVQAAIPRGDWLAYPSLGFFTLPMIDHPPVMAVPLTPRTFVTLVPKGAPNGVKNLNGLIRTKSIVGTYSMLGSGLERRFVIPASIVEQQEDPAALIPVLRSLRHDGKRHYNLIGKMAIAAGMRGWGFDDVEEEDEDE